MEYRYKKPKYFWTVFLVVIMVLAAAITCFISVRPAGIYLEWARFGVYGTSEGVDMLIPAGSIIVTDRMQPKATAYVGAVFISNGDSSYPAGSQSALVGTLKCDDGKYYINDNTGGSIAVNEWQIEPVVYYIDYLGHIAMLMYTYRYVLWGVWAAAFALVIVLICTAGNRRAKRKQKELIKIFNFYGEKFDSEEENTDY
jgi:hypothetical protein